MLIFYFGSQNIGQGQRTRKGTALDKLVVSKGGPFLGFHLRPLALELRPERKCVTHQRLDCTLKLRAGKIKKISDLC